MTCTGKVKWSVVFQHEAMGLVMKHTKLFSNVRI